MGRAIAQTVAAAGVKVTICEPTHQLAKQLIQQIREDLDEQIANWAITEDEKEIYLSIIEAASDLTAMLDMDFVIECVPEDISLKQEVFSNLDEIVPEDVVLSSNTSTISISAIASATRHPERILVTHFMYRHVDSPSLVELVRGVHTSDEAMETARALMKALGKTPIEVNEYPGYITTRLLIPLINEALFILQDEVASPEDVDRAAKLGYGFPIGPLALADLMGLDQLLYAMHSLFRELGDPKYRPCSLLRRYVRDGRLGRKTRHGIFKYDVEGPPEEKKE